MTKRTIAPPTAPSRSVLTSEDERRLDDVGNILHFLSNVQPLAGNDYTHDAAFTEGRYRILEWLEETARRIGGAR